VHLEGAPVSAARVAVIGGGVAGLAAARRLAARGDLEVVVWEAAARAGGVIATSQAGGFAREHAANGFLTAPGGAAELCEELGVAVEPARPAARKRWIVRGGALRAVPAEIVKLVGWRALAGVLAEPFRPLRRGGEDESVASFARRRLGREIAEAVVAPLCTGVFAGDPERLSVRAAFPRLAELEAEGGLLLGGAARAVRAMLHGGGRPPRARLAAPVGGMAALVDALARELGPRVRLGTPVVAIEADERRRAIRLADGRLEPCDAVVLAVPAPVAARLVSDASRELAGVLDGIEYAPVAVVHLGYRREDLAHPMDGFGFLVAPGEDLRVLGAVFESVLYSGRAPAGHLLVRCMFGGARDPGALELDDAAMIERAHQDLDRVLGVRGTPVHTNVVRWPRAIAQYTVGHQARVARAEELAEPIGVVLAGAGYHGVAVNSCVHDAGRVAHRIAARLALPLALVAALVAGACSSGAKSGGGEAAAPGDAGGERHPAAGGGQGGGARSGAGAIEVTVEWLMPPAALVGSPGRNRCGAPLRPPLEVDALGGVAGAVVTLEGASRPLADGAAAPAELAVKSCQVTPRALRLARPGDSLLVINDDERRHEVSLERLGEQGGPLAVVPLVLVGETVAVPLEQPGVVRAATAEDPTTASYVVVAPHQDVAISDEHGKVRFDAVPAGTYTISVWHPPVTRGEAAIEQRAEVAVSGGAVASATVSLAAPPGRR
jgi:oxygen-dependent protoporphyrinogen oxidase